MNIEKYICIDERFPAVCTGNIWVCADQSIPRASCSCFAPPPDDRLCNCTGSGWNCGGGGAVDAAGDGLGGQSDTGGPG